MTRTKHWLFKIQNSIFNSLGQYIWPAKKLEAILHDFEFECRREERHREREMERQRMYRNWGLR